MTSIKSTARAVSLNRQPPVQTAQSTAKAVAVRAGAAAAPSAVTRFSTAFRLNPIDREGVTSALNAMSSADRVKVIHDLPAKDLARLYTAFQGFKPLTMDSILAGETRPFTAVTYKGMNSMPVFRSFDKQVFRAADGSISGRNVSFGSFLTGPGYFSAKPGQNGEVIFDYSDSALPKQVPAGWPKVRSNNKGIGKLAFGGLKDVMIRISDDVMIGKVFRNGRDEKIHFTLVR